MKKFVHSFVFCCILLNQASAQLYTFDHFEQPYANLQGDSVLTAGQPWYNDTWDLSLGFHFKFMGHDFTALTAWNESLYFDFANEDLNIFPYTGGYLLDKAYVTPGASAALSPISIKRDGNPGSRIFKFQVRNAGFEEGTAEDSVHFQIWLYESTNVIEFHFGPVNIVSDVWDSGFQGPFVGLGSFVDSIIYSVGGAPHNPVGFAFDPNDQDPNIQLLSGPPPAGVVWRFTPQSSGTAESHSGDTWQISPNPSADWLQLPPALAGSTVRLYDAAGRLAAEQTASPEARINLAPLPAGAYTLRLETAGKVQVSTVIKH